MDKYGLVDFLDNSFLLPPLPKKEENKKEMKKNIMKEYDKYLDWKILRVRFLMLLMLLNMSCVLFILLLIILSEKPHETQ